MKTIHGVRRQALVLAAGMLWAGISCAQFVWVDEKGTRHFSDMPPPSSIPSSRIIKSPAAPSARPAAAASPESGSVPAAAVPAAPMSIAEKKADFNRRKAEREEQERKAAEASRVAADKARNCERAREFERALDSGVRIVSTDSSGERVFLSDERRKQESQDIRRMLADCK